MWPFDSAKTGEWRSVSRDPFARQEIVRRSVPAAMRPHPRGCDWCGGFRRFGNLFEYGIERDDRPGRVSPIRGRFCSIDCMRAYHS